MGVEIQKGGVVLKTCMNMWTPAKWSCDLVNESTRWKKSIQCDGIPPVRCAQEGGVGAAALPGVRAPGDHPLAEGPPPSGAAPPCQDLPPQGARLLHSIHQAFHTHWLYFTMQSEQEVNVTL